jgi:hypothetical protein
LPPSPAPAPQHSSFDFLALNLLGWVAYATFNVSLYYFLPCRTRPDALGGLAGAAAASGALHGAPPSLGAGARAADFVALIRAAVDRASPGDANDAICEYAVEKNDVVFAVHALAVTLVTAAQCCIYPRGKQRVHPLSLLTIFGVLKAALFYALAIHGGWDLGPRAAPWLRWVYWLYFLSCIKMGVTVIKYFPQARALGAGAGGLGWGLGWGPALGPPPMGP